MNVVEEQIQTAYDSTKTGDVLNRFCNASSFFYFFI